MPPTHFMYYLILTTLIGCVFAPFLLNKLDVWHAQGLFTQVLILILFSYSFFEKPKKTIHKNIPIGLLHLWVGLSTAYICYHAQMVGTYNVQNFFPYFNFLCLLIFYNIVSTNVGRIEIVQILNILKYVVISILFICVLQVFDLGQFFALTSDHHTHNNLVSGTIGNGTHLSGFLASCSPLFLMRIKRENILALILMLLVMCFTGTTKGEPSLSGFVIVPTLVLIYSLYRSKKAFFILLFVGVIACITVMIMVGPEVRSKLFETNGRIGLWSYYWDAFRSNSPVTGVGLGKINQVYKLTPFPMARHIHLEYFHFMIETGIIGLVLIGNLIVSFFRTQADDNEKICLKLMVIGFLMSCLFNYPAHLWLPSTWAMFAYASFVALENESYF